MDREVLDRWCERGILALVLAILVFAPLATGAVDIVPSVTTVALSVAQAFPLVQGLTVGVLLLWGVRLWVSSRPQLLWPPVCWAVVAFVAYAVARYWTADIEYVARLELGRVLVYAFLFLAVLNNLHRQECTHWIVYALLFVGMAESFYALYQFLTDSNHVGAFLTPYTHRGTGTFINPNNLGGFLEMLLPLGVAFALTGRVKPVARILIGYASLVIAVGVGVTLSRGAWVATAVALAALIAVLLPRRSLRLQALLLLAALIIGAALLAPRSIYLQKRIDQLTQSQQRQTADRYAIWQATLRMWNDHLWWGVGPGHFSYRFPAYRPDVIRKEPAYVHNDYLNTLADWGVVGMGIVAAALALLAWGVARMWRHVCREERDLGTKLTNKFAFVLGASLGLLALAVHSVVDFNMHIPANALLAVTLMALLASYQRYATERHWMSLRLGPQCALSLVLLGGALWLGGQVWRRSHEIALVRRAASLPETAPARIETLTNAFAVEPKNFETALAIGSGYRAQSWTAFAAGYAMYAERAQRAMDWFDRAMKLNRYDSRGPLFYATCLDRLSRSDEARPYYQRADALSPSDYFVADWIGWHYVEIGDAAAAKPWLERSYRLEWRDNPIATNYLPLVNRLMREAAAPPK